MGHEKGAERAKQLLEWCHELGIKVITLYVLSAENLTRPSEELRTLLEIIKLNLDELLQDPRIEKYKVRVKGIGSFDGLPDGMKESVSRIEGKTMGYDGHFLNIALAYGGRTEIVDVVKVLAEKARAGTINPDLIDQAMIEDNLSTAHLPNPEPDLVIRTSGEERLSGFLLWQSAYSELVFLDVYWPAFRKIDLMRAIRTYQKRNRRYGK
jgi:tritrans,polycis-undecaprenyl-diphosphate synthase [geranylgeranyl-diphosphate specific]